MALPQLSIAQRLWLGLIMLLGLFTAAHLVSFDAARDVDKTLDELIRSGDERRGAGYEMRPNLSIIVERVHAYLHDGDGRKRGAPAAIEMTRNPVNFLRSARASTSRSGISSQMF